MRVVPAEVIFKAFIIFKLSSFLFSGSGCVFLSSVFLPSHSATVE